MRSTLITLKILIILKADRVEPPFIPDITDCEMSSIVLMITITASTEFIESLVNIPKPRESSFMIVSSVNRQVKTRLHIDQNEFPA